VEYQDHKRKSPTRLVKMSAKYVRNIDRAYEGRNLINVQPASCDASFPPHDASPPPAQLALPS